MILSVFYITAVSGGKANLTLSAFASDTRAVAFTLTRWGKYFH